MFFIAIVLILLGLSANGTLAGFLAFSGGLLLMMITVARSVERIRNPSGSSTEPCPPHKWENDIQGLLYCKKCTKRPGEIMSNYDKPY